MAEGLDPADVLICRLILGSCSLYLLCLNKEMFSFCSQTRVKSKNALSTVRRSFADEIVTIARIVATPSNV